MADRFGKQVATLFSPYTDGFTIAPNNTIVFDQPTRGLYVGQNGNVSILTAGKVSNTNLTFYNVQTGSTLSVRAQMVYATGTTANLIIGLY